MLVLMTSMSMNFENGAGFIQWNEFTAQPPRAAFPVMRYQSAVFDCTLTTQIMADGRLIIYARSEGAVFEGTLLMDILLVMSNS